VSEEIVGERREVLYRGMVQGVGFRFTARHIAGRFTVVGYIRNLPDGRVRLVAEGRPVELDRFLASVYQEMGPYIEQVEQVVLPTTGEFRHFEIRH
jgi:acylphosphatase